jgi:hypothetical protein
MQPAPKPPAPKKASLTKPQQHPPKHQHPPNQHPPPTCASATARRGERCSRRSSAASSACSASPSAPPPAAQRQICVQAGRQACTNRVTARVHHQRVGARRPWAETGLVVR